MVIYFKNKDLAINFDNVVSVEVNKQDVTDRKHPDAEDVEKYYIRFEFSGRMLSYTCSVPDKDTGLKYLDKILSAKNNKQEIVIIT